MSKRSRILAFGAAAALVVLGAAGAAVFSGTLGQVVAFVLIGTGVVLATSLVFLEVGLSEDRQLAREQAAREKAERAREGHGPREGRRRPRLDRMRGRERRLK
jgi:hypothetical protein